VKLNLGCGDRYVPGWVNVDLPSMPHRKDQAVDLTGQLPWPPGSVHCVYAGHLLEHLALDHAERLLVALRRVVTPGAPIMLVGPDVDRGARLLPNGAADEYGATLDSLRFGAGRWAGDVHLWECTEALLVQLLELAGWDKVTPMNIDEVKLFWPVADPRPRWQCAVGALAPRAEKS
jgi:hypothetical protein